jgi:hypothetical protein
MQINMKTSVEISKMLIPAKHGKHLGVAIFSHSATSDPVAA